MGIQSSKYFVIGYLAILLHVGTPSYGFTQSINDAIDLTEQEESSGNDLFSPREDDLNLSLDSDLQNKEGVETSFFFRSIEAYEGEVASLRQALFSNERQLVSILSSNTYQVSNDVYKFQTNLGQTEYSKWRRQVEANLSNLKAIESDVLEYIVRNRRDGELILDSEVTGESEDTSNAEDISDAELGDLVRFSDLSDRIEILKAAFLDLLDCPGPGCPLGPVA